MSPEGQAKPSSAPRKTRFVEVKAKVKKWDLNWFLTTWAR